MSKHFSIKELQCHCGCDKCDMDNIFMEMFERAREIADIPFIISSAFRCDEHDKELNGGGNHPTGKAIDIGVINGVTRAKILFALYDAGFRRFGIGKTFLHVDSVPNKPSPCIWGY